MGGILVFAELQGGKFAKGSLGLLEEAARLGGRLGSEVHALVCGESADDALAAGLGAYGAKVAHVATGDGYALAGGVVDAVAAAQAEGAYDLLLFGASVIGSDAAAAAAVRLDAGLVIDAVELHAEDGAVVTRRAGLGDAVLAHCGFKTPVGIVVVRANTYAPSESPAAGTAEVRPLSVEATPQSRGARVVGHEQAVQEGVDISEADILAGGGRGLGTPDNFKLCEDLASALGGAVAATRAVVDAGWYPYSTQVGQTGKTVSPKLYIACGISGAIQHKVGMQGAGTIVAINKDANAPIFDFADLGVVGDLHAILPKLTELLQARR